MGLWLIPLAYVIASTVCGFTVPRLEHLYLGALDRVKARQEDRQGLGLTRKRAEPKPPPA